MQLYYCEMSGEVFQPDGSNEEYYYLVRTHRAEQEYARLSQHSPNFKMIVIKSPTMLKDYEVYDTSEQFLLVSYLPRNLNQHTVEAPNFLSNDSLLFMTEDKIIKCFNFRKPAGE
jgi:hypothetical protein